MQSLSIIQIEELVYGRLNHVSKTDWIAMLKKHGAHADYIIFKDNYFLLEQSDYRFESNKMISSERVVYNIDYATYDTAENAPDPENTDEIQIVRYDRRTDRYFVRYAHYLPSKDSVPSLSTLLSDICSEADIPSTRQAVQAPAEKHIDTPVTPRSAQPAPQPKPKPAPTPSFTSTEYHKPWRQKTLSELRRLYNSGKSLQELATIMDKFETSIVYQLKTYLGIEHPFEKAPQQPAQKPQPQSQPQQQTKPDRPVKDKHKGRLTWDGEIVLSYLYNHPGATVNEIVASQYGGDYKATKKDINHCLQGYFSSYVEKDKNGGYRLNQSGINEIRPYIDSFGTPEISVQEFQSMFQHLHRNKNANGHIAPHKIILMLAIISRSKKNVLRVMEIDNDMKVFFMDYWRKYVHSDEWAPNIYMPWEHMTSEPFWHWVSDNTKEAYLDDDLYYLLQYDKSARSVLRRTLIDMLQ